MGIPELETTLREAQARQSRAIAALTRGGEMEEVRAANTAMLQAERNLAAAKGEQYAVPIEFPVSWDTGAPLPYLMQNDYKTFLVFFLRDVDPKWDGTYVKVREPNSDLAEKLALVEFEYCDCTKMGTPNDEVLRGHPLYGKGLVAYKAMLVMNSTWLRDLEKINAVHARYNPESWRRLKHYILPFHDSTFECVASGFKVETFQMPLPSLLSEICKRLLV
ncbi:MAG TPA: hypothetical protein VFR24_12140 [Candidatus Angelobacter sp.]|nr:hypothetical protein [Candidatus Angelobacter sp.]